jgi:hypothetical protein
LAKSTSYEAPQHIKNYNLKLNRKDVNQAEVMNIPSRSGDNEMVNLVSLTIEGGSY